MSGERCETKDCGRLASPPSPLVNGAEVCPSSPPSGRVSTSAAALLALADRVERGEIKALSIKQPYPHHIFYDGKDVENRDWKTRGRGWILVHAGVSKSELCMELAREAAMPRGGVVGMMKITDCVEKMDSDWFYGRYGFVIGEAFPLPLLRCKGQLGFFLPDAEVLAEAADAIRALASADGHPKGHDPGEGHGS